MAGFLQCTYCGRTGSRNFISVSGSGGGSSVRRASDADVNEPRKTGRPPGRNADA